MKSSNALQHALIAWLPLAVAMTMVCGLLYAVLEYDLRSGADDPQIQMAEDLAIRLDAGASPTEVAAGTPVDLARSVAPYTIIFNVQGQPVASTATLSGSTPVPPPGVFGSVRTSGEDRITWQPAPGVRSAAVITRYRQGFVLAGRSLRLVEQRETDAEGIVGLFWLLTLGATALASLGAAWLRGGTARPAIALE